MPAATSLAEAARAFARSASAALPLAEDQDRYQGIVTAHAVVTALDGNAGSDGIPATKPRTVADLAVAPPAFTTGTSLATALHALTGSGADSIPSSRTTARGPSAGSPTSRYTQPPTRTRIASRARRRDRTRRDPKSRQNRQFT
ncbi:hypothetical protein [Parafrankia elaeagni]|uniref:hypothetical protein n=1 Tax=Parafrankia elaeagni TaxID=222534 RepID=UPI002DDA090F|nr:hypothetical protein [Parafrankia elaeagni]